MLTDLDFADERISDTVEQACKLLDEVERHCLMVGLGLNVKKTKVMPSNFDDSNVTTLDRAFLEVVPDFKYLGSWIGSKERDIKERRALAWSALYGIRRVWRSSLGTTFKRQLFGHQSSPDATTWAGMKSVSEAADESDGKAASEEIGGVEDVSDGEQEMVTKKPQQMELLLNCSLNWKLLRIARKLFSHSLQLPSHNWHLPSNSWQQPLLLLMLLLEHAFMLLVWRWSWFWFWCLSLCSWPS